MMTQIEQAMKSAIKSNEDLTIVGFKDDGLYDMVQTVRKNLADLAKFTTVNVAQLDSAALQSYILKRGELSNEVIVLEDLELCKSPLEIISTLDLIRRDGEHNYIVIYLIQGVDLLVMLESQLRSNSGFFKNLFYQTLELGRERDYLERYCGAKYGQISIKQKNKVYKQSNGHYEIYKYLYKEELQQNGITLQHYLSRLAKDLGLDSIRAINSYLNGYELMGVAKRIVEIYENLGVLKDRKLAIPALENILRQLNPRVVISYNQDLKLVDFDHSENFSSREIRVLSYLYELQTQPCTKESVGRVLWGQENFQQKYSDWAVDQMISRLRAKLVKFHIDAVIETAHAEGYILRV